MIIYEVNLDVQQSIAHEFALWLPKHVQAMQALGYFVKTELFLRRPEDEGRSATSKDTLWTVHYYLTDRVQLDAYLRNHAAKMRADGTERFGEQFTATRRVLELR